MIYRRVSVAGVRPHIPGDTGEAPAVTDQGIGQGIYRRDAMARLRLWTVPSADARRRRRLPKTAPSPVDAVPGSQQGTRRRLQSVATGL